MANVDPSLAGLLTAGGTILGALGVIFTNKRSGKLTMSDQQARYIQEQQQDIDDLRADLAELWDWVIAATREAHKAHVDLGPLPRSRPRSKAATN